MTRAAAALLLATTTAGCGAARDAPAGGAARVAVVEVAGAPEGPAAHARLGATLAGAEAARAATLVGRRVSVVAVRGATRDAAVAAAREAVRDGAFALVGGHDAATCAALAALADSAGVVYVNVGCREGALRDAARHPRVFHVEASEAMYRGVGSAAGAATLWHGGLTRYGAAQLNERFARQTGRPMDGAAWAGWVAVKVLAEAALRTGTTHGDSLAAWLTGGAAQFDGHKGTALRFAGDRQLQQPLYVAGAGERGGDERARDAAAAPAAPFSLPDPGAPLLLVTNEGSMSVTVVDAATLRVAGVIPLGHRPRGIHATADGARAFVALSDDAPNAEGDGDAVVALDPRAGRVLARHRAGSDPEQFALSPDGRRLYAANEDAGLATVTDLRTATELASLPVGIEPEGVAVSPDGRWVYVTAETSNTVSVIDAWTNAVAASFLVDVRPRAAAFAPDGARAYVTNEISGTVSVIDARAHRVVGRVALGEGAKPVGVAVAPDGRTVYVALGGAHAVAVVDAAAGRVVATVPVGRRPWGIAVSSDGRHVYTANGGSGDVSVVDVATRRVIAAVPVGERPWGVALIPRSRR